MIDLDVTEKIVSVVAGLISIGGLFLYFMKRRSNSPLPSLQPSPVIETSIGGNRTSDTASHPTDVQSILPALQSSSPSVADLKRVTKILFVDDDRGFKIVGVLKKMGWEYTKLIVDVSSLEQVALVEADVVFIDIQGVGKAMQYMDEGLGLALAIKRRYPSKKVVIYSAVQEGARFHEALQEADYSLPKTAEPIRFEDTIVRVMRG